MEGIKPSTTILSKAVAPQGAPTYPGGSQLDSTRRDHALNVEPDSVKSLSPVNYETLQKYGEIRTSAENKIRRQFAEGKFPPGIYKEDDSTIYVLPSSLVTEDSVTAAMITDLATYAGAEVRQAPWKPVKLTEAFDEDIILGLWFGMFSSTHLKRRRSKQKYELGRTASFALIVKNVYESDDLLGSAALIKDNFYFGNNPSEMSPKGKVPFWVKMKLTSMYDDPAIGNFVYGVLNHAASQIGFSNLKDDERDKAITENLVPVDQVIASCYPTVTARRGRQVISMSRRPNPIRASPLFLKEEMRLLSSLTSSIFTDLGAFTQGYLDSIFTHGFAFVKSEIKRLINVRLETLQRFAHVTKERLQAIRKIVKKPQLRKAGVVQDDVMSFLESIPDPARKLVSELKHITGAATLTGCYSYAFKRTPADSNEAARILYIRALEVYSEIKGLAFSQTLVIPKDSPEPSSIDYETGVRALRLVETRCGAFSRNLKNVLHIRSYKLFGRTEQVKGLKENIMSGLQTFLSLPQVTKTTCVRMYFNHFYNNELEYIDYIQAHLNDLQELAVKQLTLRDYEETDERVKALIVDLIKTLGGGFRLESLAQGTRVMDSS